MAYTQVTLNQLRTALRAKYESVPFWVTAEEDYAINEALQWYNLYTGVWRQRVVVPTTAGTVYYTIGQLMTYNVRVEYNGLPISISTLTDLDTCQPGWEGQTTADGGDIPTTVQAWAPVGMDTFVIWPADAAGNNSLLIDGVYDTPVLVNYNDTLDLDQSEIDALLGEALYILGFKDPSRFPRLDGWHQQFLATVVAHNARLKASNKFLRAQGQDLNREAHPLSVQANDH